MKLTKENIIKFITDMYEGEVVSINDFDHDNNQIELLYYELEQKFDMPFGVYVRCNAGQDDYWLQAEYYSKKLKKSVVFDTEYEAGDTLEAIADMVIRTAKEVEEFEAKIVIKE